MGPAVRRLAEIRCGPHGFGLKLGGGGGAISALFFPEWNIRKANVFPRRRLMFED